MHTMGQHQTFRLGSGARTLEVDLKKKGILSYRGKVIHIIIRRKVCWECSRPADISSRLLPLEKEKEGSGLAHLR